MEVPSFQSGKVGAGLATRKETSASKRRNEEEGRQIQPVTVLPRITFVLILPARLCLYCQRLRRRKDSPASFIKMHPVASRYNSRTPAILRCTIHQPTHV